MREIKIDFPKCALSLGDLGWLFMTAGNEVKEADKAIRAIILHICAATTKLPASKVFRHLLEKIKSNWKIIDNTSDIAKGNVNDFSIEPSFQSISRDFKPQKNPVNRVVNPKIKK